MPTLHHDMDRRVRTGRVAPESDGYDQLVILITSRGSLTTQCATATPADGMREAP